MIKVLKKTTKTTPIKRTETSKNKLLAMSSSLAPNIELSKLNLK